MLTLSDLVDGRPDLRLRWLDPVQARTHSGTGVTEVVILPAKMRIINAIGAPAPGAVVLVTVPGGRDDAAVLVQLVDYLDGCDAAALVLRVPGRDVPVGAGVRERAVRVGLPLLTTTADAEWAGINEFLQSRRAAAAERQVERLDGLLGALPAQLTDAHALNGITGRLAAALEADVAVGSAERGVLSAAPDTASNPASHLVGTAGDHLPGVAGHTRKVQVIGAGDGMTLAVASRGAFDVGALDLIHHAARLIGLYEQARHHHRSAVLGPRSASQAATQLLLGAEAVKGQIVANAIAPELMDTEEVRIRVIDTGGADREDTLRWCERKLHGRALVSPCPGKPAQIIVITPAGHEQRVASELRGMIGRWDGLLMGESGPYSLNDSGAAYAEAAQALRAAGHTAGRISTGARPKLATLLPSGPAYTWARALLGPLLRPEHRQLLQTLPAGCSFKPSEASRGLGIHRNTLRQRMSRASRLLRLDLTRVNDRVLVLLAVEILAAPAPARMPIPPIPVFDLCDLLTLEEEMVRDWADGLLRPLRSDRRDLLRTLGAWLENDLSVRRTARDLDVSEATVRNHIGDAFALTGIGAGTEANGAGNPDVVTLADIGIAAYLLTGRPMLAQRRPADTAPSGHPHVTPPR